MKKLKTLNNSLLKYLGIFYFSFLIILFANPAMSVEWDYNNLNEVFEGCVMSDANNASIWEYCGCFTHSLADNFSVFEVFELVEKDKFMSNNKFKLIVNECVIKAQ